MIQPYYYYVFWVSVLILGFFGLDYLFTDKLTKIIKLLGELNERTGNIDLKFEEIIYDIIAIRVNTQKEKK